MKQQQYLAASLLTFLLFGAVNAMAQKDSTKLRQEVEVTKAYQPTITDVLKINDIPKIQTEQTEVPVFDYSIYSKPVFSTFDVTPITAAKMVGDPRPEMGKGLLKLGLGNYLTPYGELFFNAQPDKNSTFGMHFKHLSSSGKIKLLNGDKVEAPQSEDVAEIFGSRFFKKSTLSGSLKFDHQSFDYYGYAGDILTDDQKKQIIPFWENKQYFSKGTAEVHLKSQTLSTSELTYDLGLNYHYLVSKTGQTENEVLLTGDLGKKVGNTYAALNTSVTYYRADSIMNRVSNVYGQKQQILVKINPSVKWLTKSALLQLGLNSTMVFDDDANASFLVWPKVKAEWSPVERILTLFAGVDGYLQHNTYSAIAAENPYINPYHDVANSNYKYVFSGGLKGKLSSKTNYIAEVTYSKVSDQHFYIINSYDLNNLYPIGSRSLSNTFDCIYDDVNILKLSGEVLHSVSDNFSLHLLSNYYSYNLKSIQKAWQMPVFDLTFSGIYKPTEQLKFNADIFVAGSRTALMRDYWAEASGYSGYGGYGSGYYYRVADEKAYQMDPIIDLNLGAEYQYSKSISFFAKLNNFGFQKYEQWLGYTSKSLNWMAGASYSF